MGSISDEKIQETFQEDIHDETPESAIYRKKEAKHVWKLDLLHCTSHNASHADQLSGSRKQLNTALSIFNIFYILVEPQSLLYIIEGIIIIVWVGICIYVVLKNYEAAYFLNEDDRVTMRRRAELAEAYSGGTGRYGMKDMKEAAKDTKSWLHEVIQICVVTILYGSGTFLPLMITNGFHYSTVQAQYLVIPGKFLSKRLERRVTDQRQSISGVLLSTP
ncbi:hypothetical protein ACEPPN_010130 [Leptodophora sp. 'Broadleaf-Isolate-01']